MASAHKHQSRTGKERCPDTKGTQREKKANPELKSGQANSNKWAETAPDAPERDRAAPNWPRKKQRAKPQIGQEEKNNEREAKGPSATGSLKRRGAKKEPRDGEHRGNEQRRAMTAPRRGPEGKKRGPEGKVEDCEPNAETAASRRRTAPDSGGDEGGIRRAEMRGVKTAERKEAERRDGPRNSESKGSGEGARRDRPRKPAQSGEELQGGERRTGRKGSARARLGPALVVWGGWVTGHRAKHGPSCSKVGRERKTSGKGEKDGSEGQEVEQSRGKKRN